MIAASLALRWDGFEGKGLTLLGFAHPTGSLSGVQAGRMCSIPPITPSAPMPISPTAMYSRIQLSSAVHEG